MKYVGGVDVGSTQTKAVIMQENEHARIVARNGPELGRMIKQSELRQAYLSGDSVSMLRNGRLIGSRFVEQNGSSTGPVRSLGIRFFDESCRKLLRIFST